MSLPPAHHDVETPADSMSEQPVLHVPLLMYDRNLEIRGDSHACESGRKGA